MQHKRGYHVVVVGCGAIGSFLVPLLPRIVGITRITLVDPDTFTISNLRNQNILRCDVGEPKVAALARRLRVANRQLEVTAIPSAVEDVPLGVLRADLILSCTDTKKSRQTVNEFVFRLGVPWIDAGVLESLQLVRVTAFSPSADSACLECAWDRRDYEALETEYPCGATPEASSPSDTSAALASLAASLLSIESQRVLDGDQTHAAAGPQLTLDARTHRLFSTSFRRNPNCRFNHAAWAPVALRCLLQKMTVREVLDITGGLRVAGHRFARHQVCPDCGHRVDGLRLDRPKSRCVGCGKRMIALGFDAMLDRLDTSLTAEEMNRSLAQIGLRAADVICGDDKQFELRTEAL